MQKLDIDKRDHALSILQRLDAMRKMEKSCDFVIKVKEEEMKVHRSVLMAGSDYFDAMFSHDTAEKKYGMVEMKDVNFLSVQKCVDFIYTGEIAVSVEVCDNLLYVASMMQLETVREKVAEFLEGYLCIKFFPDIQNLASKYSLVHLSSACNEFVLENLNLLVNEKFYYHFELEELKLLLSCKSPSAFICTEESKFSLMINWIKTDTVNHQCHLVELVNFLDLSKIRPSFVKYLVDNEPLCSGSGEFMAKVFPCNADISEVTAEHAPLEYRIPELNAILLFGGPSDPSYVYRLDDNSVSEFEGTGWSFCNSEMVAINLKTKVYVVVQDGKCFMLSIERRKWFKLPSVGKEFQSAMRAASYETSIYVADERTIEEFSIVEKEWKTIHVNDLYRHYCELAAFDNNIFCLGGFDNNNSASSNVNAFNPVSKSWTTRQSMLTARITPAAVGYKGKLYVAGGFSGYSVKSDVEVYDAESSLWTIIAPMGCERDRFTLCVLQNRLYAVGGCEPNTLDSLEKYDDDKKKWSIIKRLPGDIDTEVPIILPGVDKD